MLLALSTHKWQFSLVALNWFEQNSARSQLPVAGGHCAVHFVTTDAPKICLITVIQQTDTSQLLYLNYYVSVPEYNTCTGVLYWWIAAKLGVLHYKQTLAHKQWVSGRKKKVKIDYLRQCFCKSFVTSNKNCHDSCKLARNLPTHNPRDLRPLLKSVALTQQSFISQDFQKV